MVDSEQQDESSGPDQGFTESPDATAAFMHQVPYHAAPDAEFTPIQITADVNAALSLPSQASDDLMTGGSDLDGSLGDLSDVDTEVDDEQGPLPLLPVRQATPPPLLTLDDAEPVAEASNNALDSLFDGLVLLGSEEPAAQQLQQEAPESAAAPPTLPDTEAEALPAIESAEAADLDANVEILQPAAPAEVIEAEAEPSVLPDEAPVAAEEPLEAAEEAADVLEDAQHTAEPPSLPYEAETAASEEPPLPPAAEPPSVLPDLPQPSAAAPVAPSYPNIPGASALELAELAEARLASGAAASSSTATTASEFSSDADARAFKRQLLVARLASQLDQFTAGEAAEPAAPAASSTAIGPQLAGRAFLSPQLEPAFKPPSVPGVVAKYLGIVAVGSSAGTVNVLMPKTARGPAQLHVLEDKAAAGDSVTSLALGQHGGGLLLISGHASGQLRLWETRLSGGSSSGSGGGMAWGLARGVGGIHAAAVTACALLDGGAITVALSADAHGRLVSHNINRLLSPTAQALAGFARQLAGGGSGAAAASSVVTLQAAGQDPGVILTAAPLLQSSAQKALYSTPDGSRFVLLAATRAVLLCSVAPEGALSILHAFLPPAALRGEGAGYAAWRLDDAPSQSSTTNSIVSIAWVTSVSVYRAVLTRPKPPPPPQGSPGASPRPSPPAPLPPPRLVASFSSGEPVAGLGFIGAGTLAVVTASGEVATDITLWHAGAFKGSCDGAPQVPEGGVETLHVSDWLAARQLGIPGAASLHAAVAAGGDQLLILTSCGVRVVHLMTWQQRLSTLVGLGKLELALLCAVRLHLGAAAAAAGAAAADRGLWPADWAPPGEIEEVSRQLLTILRALVDSKLGSLEADRAAAAAAMAAAPLEGPETAENAQKEVQTIEEAAEQLADVAINACLLLERPDSLFSDIAPRFLSSPLSAALLTQLEPRILSDVLPHLAPEVVQALVEHFSAAGAPHRMERCVIKLDVLSLDLNQLIPLCLRHRLYGALVHIFNGAMQDWQTPATLLAVAAAEAAAASGGWNDARDDAKQALEASEALRLGYRLLVYVKGCLEGARYPPGTGPAPPLEAQAIRMHAVTFLLHSTAASLLETRSLWASVAHLDGGSSTATDASALAAAGLRDPAPALRMLCEMDSEAVLRVLREGLAGWDALESDLIELTPGIAPLIAAHPGRTVTQAAVDAVVALLTESSVSGVSGGGGGGVRSRDFEPAALRFVAEHLAANRAAAEGDVLLRVLRFLAQESSTTATNSSDSVPAVERESIFRDIVAHLDAGTARSEALKLAQAAGFHQAEARILHTQRAHAAALRCLTADGARHPDAPFRYLRDAVLDPGLSEAEKDAVRDEALALAPQLVRIDAAGAAAAVADCLPGDAQRAVLEALEPWPDDQFAFLQAALEGGSNGEEGKRPGSAFSLDSTAVFSSAQSHHHPLLAPLLLQDKGVSSLYVRLLCRFRPAAVLPFLQTSDAYDVDACLGHCLAAGVHPAAAYLLERRGDVRGALEICLEEVDAANTALLAAGQSVGDLEAIQGLSEHAAARGALQAAVSMCVRFSQDRVDDAAVVGAVGAPAAVGGGNGLDEDPLTAVWFEVLQRYVEVIRQLQQERREMSNDAAGGAPAASSSRLASLEAAFTAFMEEVIGQMAGHVPLQSVAAAVMERHGRDGVGDHRATLSSLLGACAFELSILRCASRVTGTDTMQMLKKGYQRCMAPETVGGDSSSSGGGLGVAAKRPASRSAMALARLESAQQLGQEAWARAAAAAGPAASRLLRRAAGEE